MLWRSRHKESRFKSIDVGMERGARCIRVGCRPDPDRPGAPKKFGAIARAAKRQVKRLAAGWGLPGNCATVRADKKLRHVNVGGLAEINRGPPGISRARRGTKGNCATSSSCCGRGGVDSSLSVRDEASERLMASSDPTKSILIMLILQLYLLIPACAQASEAHRAFSEGVEPVVRKPE
jgi:hypothetical protein